MPNQFRCSICGRFISHSNLDNGKAKGYCHDPVNDQQYEFYHVACDDPEGKEVSDNA